MKTVIFNRLDSMKTQMCAMADYLYDNPETDCKEYKAMELLTKYLSDNGYNVEMGVGGLETSFRAIYENGTGGPSIGLLCEYDALENMGHACGHHMQGPAAVAAAVALKEIIKDYPYKIVVYGTPAEETSGGKIIMLENGCFKDIDVALMSHGGPTTTTDIKCMALATFTVKFTGKSAHAAIKPESGRSALDALLLSFNAIEFMREHVKDDTRIHYTVVNAGGPDNVVPAEAIGTFGIRSYSTAYLDTVVNRFEKIIEGASLMTETTYEIKADRPFESKIPVLKLNDVLMENAKLINAPTIRPPREKTGSTDFGNVMHMVPGSCIRVAFVQEGTSAHSQEYLDAGKTEDAHNATLYAAKVLAASCYDLISDKKLICGVKAEFEERKKHEEKSL